MIPSDTLERFWSFLAVVGECHEWQGSLDNRGYGKFKVGGKTRVAHRWLFKLLFGPLRKRDLVLHSCDNRRCCNPHHLSKGSHKHNMRERNERGRAACGERNGSVKLSQNEAGEIKKLGDYLIQKEIAEMFGISQTQVGRIVRGERWRNSDAGNMMCSSVETSSAPNSE